MLPDVVRGIVRLLQRAGIVEDRVHQLAGREAAGQVVVGVRCRRGLPTFHRAVLHAHGHAEALRVVEDWLEDLLELDEVLLKATILTTEHVIIAHEGAADDVIRVTTQEGRDADELENVVLVDDLVLRIAADEVVVGAHGDAEPLFVAATHDHLRIVEVELLVVKVRRRVVRAVGVAAEHAELEALGAHALRAPEDVLEGLAREGGRHQPNRIVHRFRGPRTKTGELCALGLPPHCRNGCGRRTELEEIASVHILSLLKSWLRRTPPSQPSHPFLSSLRPADSGSAGHSRTASGCRECRT